MPDTVLPNTTVTKPIMARLSPQVASMVSISLP
jgi:hypothetical protein